MKHRLLLALSLCLLLLKTTASLQAQSSYAGDNILGVWLTEDKGGKVEIYKSGNKYYGKLIWGNRMFEADGKTSKKDVKNENPSLRSRPLQYLVFLRDFTYQNGAWENGSIYNSDDGQTYSGSMRLESSNTLILRGYVGFSMLGKNTTWTRVQ